MEHRIPRFVSVDLRVRASPTSKAPEIEKEAGKGEHAGSYSKARVSHTHAHTTRDYKKHGNRWFRNQKFRIMGDEVYFRVIITSLLWTVV